MTDSARHKTHLIAVLPTSLTLGNAVCGFAAISCATQIPREGILVHPFYIAGILILVAMVFDALDGSVARLTRQTSRFGAQLDSLCDLVSFGMAPAVLLLQLPGGISSRLTWCIALLFVLCAALRLARFNAACEGGERVDGFCGLPSPAAAGALASVVVLRFSTGVGPAELNGTAEWMGLLGTAALPWIALLLAGLMVSKIRYSHPLKNFLQGKRTLIQLVQFGLIPIAVFAVHELALPLIFLAFALGAPVRALLIQATTGRMRSKYPAFTYIRRIR